MKIESIGWVSPCRTRTSRTWKLRCGPKEAISKSHLWRASAVKLCGFLALCNLSLQIVQLLCSPAVGQSFQVASKEGPTKLIFMGTAGKITTEAQFMVLFWLDALALSGCSPWQERLFFACQMLQHVRRPFYHRSNLQRRCDWCLESLLPWAKGSPCWATRPWLFSHALWFHVLFPNA